MYLAEVGAAFAQAMFVSLGAEANQVRDVAHQMDRAERISPAIAPTVEEWERRVEASIVKDTSIAPTERDALIKARRGQGKFRLSVMQVEQACRVTKV